MDMEKSPAFQEFLKLLNENGRADQGQDLSLMAWYLDGMERQFDAVLQELQNVKAELALLPEPDQGRRRVGAGQCDYGHGCKEGVGASARGFAKLAFRHQGCHW